MTDAERYDRVCYDLSRRLTDAYSSSFGMASRLFSAAIRPHVYAIYGMVRVADEIVDTYAGPNMEAVLTDFENDVTAALTSGYSSNPIIHSFACTARRFGIDASLIEPFFTSMRTDLTVTSYTQSEYESYIYGSAEVIGLMCLKVFVDGNDDSYEQLAPGARALGSAYQKVNFLRDIASDHDTRGRAYFPLVTYERFGQADKDAIVADITRDFERARTAVNDLPTSSRRAVATSYRYYRTLLAKLDSASVDDIKTSRVRLPNGQKVALLVTGSVRRRVSSS